MFEILFKCEGRRHIKVGQMVRVCSKVDIAPLRNSHSVRQGCWPISEHGSHLVAIFQIKLVPVIAKPVLVVDVLARSDTQQDIMWAMVPLFEIVNVVGAHKWQSKIFGDRM